MGIKEAIDTIKSNYPPEQYTMLREALDMAVIALEKSGIEHPPTKSDYVAARRVWEKYFNTDFRGPGYFGVYLTEQFERVEP